MADSTTGRVAERWLSLGAASLCGFCEGALFEFSFYPIQTIELRNCLTAGIPI